MTKRPGGNPANRTSGRVTPKRNKARIVEPTVRKQERLAALIAARTPLRTPVVHDDFANLSRAEQDALLRDVLGG